MNTPTERYESREEVASKVEWEGGLDEVLRYGLTANHLPEGDEELASAWRDMELAFLTFEQASDRVDDLLPHATEF